MFWGIIVKPHRKYYKCVSTPFHISQAVLDVSTAETNTDVKLILEHSKVDYTLCVLRNSETVQVPLDLQFSEGDEITFRSVGGTVHLTGYLLGEQDSESNDDVVPAKTALVSAPKTIKKMTKPSVEQGDCTNEDESGSDESQYDETSDDEDEREDQIDGSESESEEEAPKKSVKLEGTIKGVSKKDDKKQKQLQLQAKTDKRIEDVRAGKGAKANPRKKV